MREQLDIYWDVSFGRQNPPPLGGEARRRRFARDKGAQLLRAGHGLGPDAVPCVRPPGEGAAGDAVRHAAQALCGALGRCCGSFVPTALRAAGLEGLLLAQGE